MKGVDLWSLEVDTYAYFAVSKIVQALTYHPKYGWSIPWFCLQTSGIPCGGS